MRIISKNKRAFTLIEIILVVTIIVILAGVLVLNVAPYINKSHDASDAVNSDVSTMAQGAAASEAKLASFGF